MQEDRIQSLDLHISAYTVSYINETKLDIMFTEVLTALLAAIRRLWSIRPTSLNGVHKSYKNRAYGCTS